MDTKQKVVTLKELTKIVADLKKQGKKIVTTNGAFDILHIDHKTLLEESKLLGNILIVGVNSDASVRQYKSDLRPILPQRERAELVAALFCVDYVVIFDDPAPINFLELVRPDIHTKGGDYSAEELLETATVRKNGGEVVIVRHPVRQTTTGIIDRILKIYKKSSLYWELF